MAEKEASLLIKIKEAGGETLKNITKGLAGLYASVVAYGVAAVKAYAEQEAATNKLNQSLIQQGIYSKDLSKQYQDLATSLSLKTGVGDEEIIAAQAVMQSHLGETKISKELMQATLDLAAAKGMDLTSAAEMVAKSVGTSTNALKKQGIELTEGGSKAERMAAVTEKLNRKFGGQAEAATQGLGSLKLLTNATGELMEMVGGMLQPVVVRVSQAITEFTLALQTNEFFVDSVSETFMRLVQTGSLVYSVIKTLGQVIGQTFGSIFYATAQAMEGNFSQAFETLKTGLSDVTSTMTDNWKEFNSNMDAIETSFRTKKQENMQSEEAMLKQSLENKRAIQAENDATKLEDMAIRDQAELEQLIALEKAKTDTAFVAEMNRLENEKKNAATRAQRLDAELAQSKLKKEKMLQWDLLTDKQRMDSLATVGSHAEDLMDGLVTLTQGKNKVLLAAQKALAIAMVIVNGEVAKMRALAELGPIAGGVAAGIITASQVVGVATIASQGLAEGGIVTARPGGMLATIGEGGRDEAVIPLENGRVPGMQGNITIIVNGGLLGDEASAYELARALDRQLLKLQQSGDSVSSDRRA